MNIQGLQKLTLLDYPGKVGCTIFTGGCNLRCPFCHNASLVTKVKDTAELKEEEVWKFLKKRQGVLDGVCISGGEPLLQNDIEEFIRNVKALGYSVKLDTNGTFPEKLEMLVEKGLIDYVAMDIKNSLNSYGKTVGIDGYDTSGIERSVKFLKEGSVPYEFRTTVVKELHKKEDFLAIGVWLEGDSHYFLQQFVDSGDVIQDGLHGYSEHIMRQIAEMLREYVPNTSVRGLD